MRKVALGGNDFAGWANDGIKEPQLGRSGLQDYSPTEDGGWAEASNGRFPKQTSQLGMSLTS
jgi:hypothetical protein